ncbi:putative tRNA (guanine-N(7)-)-methyltransferase subunit TRM82 [Blattamonas nauphoetae]|uniref:tRNA (Guanine-N(7)-)-methyltransferase subunit TRM82 n=1 Tax=Blattamonas nauphoetae TaxID=2049346 RepID=A0ABQ9Y4B2_9EUKA|nr:putative tRNA (guanine-N(7)-)-methyltransferase subunit TRM82 [Blattamonas nauphoetae]
MTTRTNTYLSCFDVKFSPCESSLLASSLHNTFVYSLSDHSIQTILPEENSPIVTTLASHLLHNTPWVILSTDQKELIAFNTQTKEQHHLKIPKKVAQITGTSSGEMIICADKQGEIYMLPLSAFFVHLQPTSETTDSKPHPKITYLLGHKSAITAISLSPDDKYLATADKDEKIRVSHFPNTHEIASFCFGPSEPVTAMVWVKASNIFETVPSGFCDYLLVSSSLDGSIRLWNPSDGTLLGVEFFAPLTQEYINSTYLHTESKETGEDGEKRMKIEEPGKTPHRKVKIEKTPFPLSDCSLGTMSLSVIDTKPISIAITREGVPEIGLFTISTTPQPAIQSIWHFTPDYPSTMLPPESTRRAPDPALSSPTSFFPSPIIYSPPSFDSQSFPCHFVLTRSVILPSSLATDCGVAAEVAGDFLLPLSAQLLSTQPDQLVVSISPQLLSSIPSDCPLFAQFSSYPLSPPPNEYSKEASPLLLQISLETLKPSLHPVSQHVFTLPPPPPAKQPANSPNVPLSQLVKTFLPSYNLKFWNRHRQDDPRSSHHSSQKRVIDDKKDVKPVSVDRRRTTRRTAH